MQFSFKWATTTLYFKVNLTVMLNWCCLRRGGWPCSGASDVGLEVGPGDRGHGRLRSGDPTREDLARIGCRHRHGNVRKNGRGRCSN